MPDPSRRSLWSRCWWTGWPMKCVNYNVTQSESREQAKDNVEKCRHGGLGSGRNEGWPDLWMLWGRTRCSLWFILFGVLYCVFFLFSAWAVQLKCSISCFYTEPLPTEVASIPNDRLHQKKKASFLSSPRCLTSLNPLFPPRHVPARAGWWPRRHPIAAGNLDRSVQVLQPGDHALLQETLWERRNRRR